jgi:hypothetical protein
MGSEWPNTQGVVIHISREIDISWAEEVTCDSLIFPDNPGIAPGYPYRSVDQASSRAAWPRKWLG